MRHLDIKLHICHKSHFDFIWISTTLVYSMSIFCINLFYNFSTSWQIHILDFLKEQCQSNFYFCCIWSHKKPSTTSRVATVTITRNSWFVVFVVVWFSVLQSCICKSRLKFCMLLWFNVLLWYIWNYKFLLHHLLVLQNRELSTKSTGWPLKFWLV